MASPSRPTLENLKNKPSAVIFLSAAVETLPAMEEGGFGFDWFNTPEAAGNCFDDMVAFNKKDVEEYGADLAFMTIEVLDTKKMEFGRFDVQPVTDETKKWMDSVQKDPLHLAVFIEADAVEKKAAAVAAAKKKVRPRKKSEATVTKIEDAPRKRAASKTTAATPAKATPETTAKKKAVVKKSTPAKATAASSTTTDDAKARLRKRLAAKKSVEPATT